MRRRIKAHHVVLKHWTEEWRVYGVRMYEGRELPEVVMYWEMELGAEL
jgi:hypothetical protein